MLHEINMKANKGAIIEQNDYLNKKLNFEAQQRKVKNEAIEQELVRKIKLKADFTQLESLMFNKADRSAFNNLHERVIKLEQFIDQFEFDTPSNTKKDGSKVQFSSSVISDVSFQNVLEDEKEDNTSKAESVEHNHRG